MALPQTDLEAVDRAFGEVLRNLRFQAGLSQERLGLDIGSGRTYISQLERGERGPTLRTVFRLSARLGLPASAMVELVESYASRSTSA